MERLLHILKSDPDETVVGLIEALSGAEGATVVSLYPDQISGSATDWSRLVRDIFAYDRVICWW